jgi:hypothetical protein
VLQPEGVKLKFYPLPNGYCAIHFHQIFKVIRERKDIKWRYNIDLYELAFFTSDEETEKSPIR